MRTGDTAANDRQKLIRRPPDLLITTPESLYLMLTSSARDTLAGVETVIIDEIHAMAATKRGAHLALTLERLELVTERPPQRIGLSATQRPLEEVAEFLGGYAAPGVKRPVAIVDAGIRKALEIEVVIPVEDMSQLGQVTVELTPGPAAAALTERRSSIWPSIYPEILTRILANRSTIIFCNGRRATERLAAKLNELYDEQRGEADEHAIGTALVMAHHGSLAREQRVVIEDQLKRGELRAIVATSSLELGIDMGAVDLVIQVESPGAVSRGLQRIGRAGHSVGAPSRGSIFPKHRGDLLEAAIVTRRMVDGLIESTHFLRNPLDVLAQQIVAHVAAVEECSVDEVAPARAGVRELRPDLRRAAQQRARPAVGALSERGVLRTAAPPRVGPGQRSTARPRRVEAARRHLRRHDPRSRPVRRVPPRRHPGRRTRRGDGLRIAPRRDVRLGSVHVAHRGHHVRAGHRQSGARPARQDAVLARRPTGAPVGVGSGARRIRPRDP